MDGDVGESVYLTERHAAEVEYNTIPNYFRQIHEAEL
jgi:hypothetical protein